MTFDPIINIREVIPKEGQCYYHPHFSLLHTKYFEFLLPSSALVQEFPVRKLRYELSTFPSSFSLILFTTLKLSLYREIVNEVESDSEEGVSI